jgi:hypothetical protein
MQPLPQPNNQPAIADLVIADFVKRKRIDIERRIDQMRERRDLAETALSMIRGLANEHVEHADGCGLLAGQILDMLAATPLGAGLVLPPAETIAQRFHEAYERLAPMFGYRTREASAKPWEDVPADNQLLMIATVTEVREWLLGLGRPLTAKDPANG